MLSSTPWFQIAQEGIYAIREYDTHTPILIDGDSFATARNWVAVSDNLRTLNDPADNLIYTAHCYFDHDSSGEYSKSYDNSGANEQTGVNRLKPFVEWCQQYGLRGFVGEYGIPDDDTRWLTVLENALAYLKENGIGGTYWSAGHRWGDYKLAVHPTNNYQTDRPQMASLVKDLFYPDGQPTGNPQLPIANSQDDGLWYTLQGVPVIHPGRGIYIHNGRKVVR
jgi:endoglucanase